MNRPLMINCLVYLLTLAAAILLPSSYLPAAAIILVAAAAILFITSFFYRHLKKYSVLLLVSVFSMVSFIIYSYTTIRPASELAGKTANITATVLQTEVSGDGSKYYVAKLNSINNESSPRDIKIMLYCTNSDSLHDYDKIAVQVNFFPKSQVSSSEQFFLSNSILGSAMTLGDVKITNKNDFSLLREICRIRDKIVLNIRASIPSEEGNIISGILFGKRDYISNNTTDLFAISGISHLLAVSGLHLSIIVSLINMLLLLIGIRKIPRTIIALICTVLMMIMTGFSPSIVRAAVMTTTALIGECIRREYDSPTALALSAVIICIASPYTITNIGFLLSFSATLGIIVSQNIIEKERAKFSLKSVSVPRLILHEIEKLILPCFFAFMFTIPISACVFGYISCYAPIINFIISPLLPFLLAFSLFAAIFSLTPFSVIYEPLFYLAKLITKCIIWIAEAFSKLPFAKIYIKSDFTIFIVIVFVIIFLIAMLSKRPYKNSFAAALLCIPVICTAIISQSFIYKDTVKISILKSKPCAVMVEYNGKRFINGYSQDAAYSLKSSLRSSEDDSIYMFSAENMPSSNVASFTNFMNDTDISYLVIPKEHSGVFASLKTQNTQNVFTADNFSISYGNLSFTSEKYEKNSAAFYSIGGFKIAYLNIQSPNLLPDDFSCDLLIANANTLPFIHKYKAKYFILSEECQDSTYLSLNLKNKGIFYLGDNGCEALYLKGERLYQKSQIL